MRIACVYRDFNMDGSLQRHSVVLARELAAMGHDVHCYGNAGTATADLGDAVLHDVRPLVASRGRVGYAVECLSFATAATRAVRNDRSDYDLVHVSGTAGWELDAVTVHAVVKAEQERWVHEQGDGVRWAGARATAAPLMRPQISVARAIESLQLRPGRYRKVLAVTQQVRDDLERVHAVPRSAIEVVPYPITFEPASSRADDELRHGELRQRLGLPREAPVLLFLGHDFQRKGLWEAIRALPGLRPPAHLVVVGSGARAPFAELARELGVDARVHFVGGSDHPEQYLTGADVFVLPTHQEPWGITLIEAMAAGVPVVTTRVAGAADEVERAGAGIVLDDGSPAAVGDAVAHLLNDVDLRRRMGERGRARSGRFSPRAFAESFLEACTDAARTAGSAP